MSEEITSKDTISESQGDEHLQSEGGTSCHVTNSGTRHPIPTDSTRGGGRARPVLRRKKTDLKLGSKC